MAQFRFRLLAQELKLCSGDESEYKRVQDLWKLWQDEYCAAELPGLAQKSRRKAFANYVHKTIGPLGVVVLRAVLQTGRSANSLHATFMAAVCGAARSDPVQTRRAPRPTKPQVAKKARRFVHREQNKAEIGVCEENGCEVCYARPAGALRSCQTCHLHCCLACLPLIRSCCPRCPAVDLIVQGREAPQLCDKCNRKCPGCSEQCQDCQLWLCAFCIFHGTKRCRRNCLQGPSYASDRQSRSLDLYPQVASIIEHAREGSASKRAADLSAQVDSRRTDLPSTYERLVKLLK